MTTKVCAFLSLATYLLPLLTSHVENTRFYQSTNATDGISNTVHRDLSTFSLSRNKQLNIHDIMVAK